MATIGQSLPIPESGWRRFDSFDDRFLFTGIVSYQYNASYYNGGYCYWANPINNTIVFRFFGTKIRYIGHQTSNRTAIAKITIDGVEYTFNQYSASTITCSLDFELTNLPLGVHSVVVSLTESKQLAFDAIDIDDTGYLCSPLDGWMFYDDAHPVFKYTGTWNSLNNNGLYYGGNVHCRETSMTRASNKINFRFKGTKLRIMGFKTNKSGTTQTCYVNVDGVDYTFVQGGASAYTYKYVNFEKTDFEDKEHDVEISVIQGSLDGFYFDGIMIGENDRILYPNEVLDPKILDIGKLIRASYVASSNQVGSLSGIGKVTENSYLSTSPQPNPVGDFYFVMVGYDNYGRQMLIADRCIQSGISWNVLNEAGIASGSGIPITIDSQTYYLRLLRSVSYGVTSDIGDDEYSKYLEASSLNGTISAGDINFWNHSSGSWTQSTRAAIGEKISRTYYGLNENLDPAASGNFRPALFSSNFFDKSNLQSFIAIKSPYKNIGNGYTGYDIDSSFTVLNRNDLPGSIFIRPWGLMQAKIAVAPIYFNDLPSSIITKNINELACSVGVKPNGVLHAKIDIMPPPSIKVNLPIIDAFVRSQVPRLNYGTVGDLMIGYDAAQQENYRVFMAADTSAIPPGMTLLSAKLGIYSDASNQPPMEIQFQLNDASFTETGVTWDNQPDPSADMFVSTIGEKQGYIEFDVLTYVKDWYDGKAANNGFSIRPNDETLPHVYRLFAKEQTVNKPYLEVLYQDPVIYSIAFSWIDCSLTVRRSDFKELKSSLVVKSNWDRDEIPGTIHVRNTNYMLESSIAVSKPDLPTTIKISRRDDSSLAASLTINQFEIQELPTTLFVNPVYLKSKITIQRTESKELFCSVTVQRSDQSTFLSVLSISRHDLQGSISVFDFSHLPSSLVPVLQNRLPSSVLVNVRDTADLQSSITVAYSGESDLTSEIYVLSGYLASSINIPYRESKDLRTTLTISTFFVKDLESRITVGAEQNHNGEYVYIL